MVGLILPERESNPVSSSYAKATRKDGRRISGGVDVTATVAGVMAYEQRDDYIRTLVPEYAPGCRYNISRRPTFSRGVLQLTCSRSSLPTDRQEEEARFRGVRAITSFANIKIRARMIHLYREAESRGYVVAGTTNRTEYLLGDFCKYGDGGTDIEALAHLYKNQIYQLADYLGVTPDIVDRPPSPDTFSLPVTDQEFFFRIPFDRLDHLLYAWEHGVGVPETASALGLGHDAVKRAFTDFTTKNRATAHLRQMPGSIPYEIAVD